MGDIKPHQVPLRIPEGQYQAIKARADSLDLSVNEWIIRALRFALVVEPESSIESAVRVYKSAQTGLR